jgi:hypothetical protein
MTAKEFMKAISHDSGNIIEIFLDMLKQTRTPYCLIGGLAVNAYVEPVVSLDLDIVVITANRNTLCQKAIDHGLKVEECPHSINLSSIASEIRIQLQTDIRYQDFILRSSLRKVLGYRMVVACLEDVLQGKVWAYQDESRRKSKKQKDLADIARIIETYPDLLSSLPESIRTLLQ